MIAAVIQTYSSQKNNFVEQVTHIIAKGGDGGVFGGSD